MRSSSIFRTQPPVPAVARSSFALTGSIALLVLALVACSLPASLLDQEAASTSPPPATTVAPDPTASDPSPTSPPPSSAPTTAGEPASEHRCGDGLCDGPENTSNCPGDCAGGAPQVTPGLAEPSPLYVGLSVHLEGYPLGNKHTGYNQDVYDRYTERILAYSDLANEYGMPLTWETANLIGPSGAFEPNVLQELHRRGDGVGLHADLGGDPSTSGGLQKLTAQLRMLRTDMEGLGVPVVHASGICSELDWVTAARRAGIEATSGVVNYCLKSLPIDQQPPEVRACAGPGDGVCHDPYPGDMPAVLHPWRAADGSSWTTPSAEGLLIVPTLGTIHGLYEKTLPNQPHTGNPMTSEDVEVAVGLVEEALAARSPTAFNGVFFVWSFGQAIEHDLLRAFFEGLQPYAASGDLVWQTMPQLIETYEEASR